MGFKQTSEGRVFFKGPDNDDAPPPKSKNGIPKDPVITTDQTQMQILLLLKSLNTKLKDTKQGSEELKKQLAEYKKTIADLEEKATEQQNNYIDLEQKLSLRQNEAGKKTARVEENVKVSLKKIDEARKLVKAIEDKHAKQSADLDEKYAKTEETLKTAKTEIKAEVKAEVQDVVKSEIGEQKKEITQQKQQITQHITQQKQEITKQKQENEKLAERQKLLEKRQKEQGEKMVNNVAAYVALTKRVSETETRQATLDNKIEEATAEFLKLDRKIDKALEDRARMLRKMERIENAVIETKEALNAKAMVLLTNQGAIGGVDIPKITDEMLQTDPVALNRRLHEETLLPWWRRPVRLQATSLALLMILVLLIGWIVGEVRYSTSQNTNAPPVTSTQDIPKVSLNGQDNGNVHHASQASLEDQTADSAANTASIEESARAAAQNAINASPAPSPAKPDYGIRIHKGSLADNNAASEGAADSIKATASAKSTQPSSVSMASNSASGKNDIRTVDIKDEKEMLAVLEDNPDKLAARLNQIEPSSLHPADKTPEPPAHVRKKEPIPPPPVKYDAAYKQALMARIPPDPNLPEVAKRIEEKAYSGVPEAQHDMGAIYVAGHGSIKKDVNRAILWFQEAAKNGVANAKYNLAVLYHQGIGVKQDIAKAMTLYEEAAKQGHPEAQYNLGIAHIEGIGVPYDPRKAASYFEAAANQGVTEAAYNLGLIYENGLLGDTRPDDALMWYKEAADKGSPEARAALEQLANSLGISLDDVNRIVERVKQAKQSSASSAEKPPGSDQLIAGIQTELMHRGLYPGPVDGMAGPMTSQAIRSFQSAANLDVNGQPSKELLDFLKASSQYGTNSL